MIEGNVELRQLDYAQILEVREVDPASLEENIEPLAIDLPSRVWLEQMRREIMQDLAFATGTHPTKLFPEMGREPVVKEILTEVKQLTKKQQTEKVTQLVEAIK